VVLKSVSENWGQPNCPSGYKIGATYYWAGIEAACDCYSSSRYHYGWKRGECNNTEEAYKCRNLVDVGPKHLYIFNDTNVCVKKEKKLNYFKMDRPVLTNSTEGEVSKCPAVNKKGQKLKMCGKEIQPEYQMCIPEDVACPMTSLGWDLETSTLTKHREDSEHFPLVHFTMSQGKPCIF
jgi:hypothetical protein